jgi:hypothetical protein
LTFDMATPLRSLCALGLSALLHTGVLLAPPLMSHADEQLTPVRPDVWSGRTLDVEVALNRTPVEPQPGSPAESAAKPRFTRAFARAGALGSVAGLTAAARAEGAATPRAEQRSVASALQNADFGSEGLPPGVRRLASAFTRAVPAATSRDPVWLGLPLGSAGKLRVAIALDEEGRIARTDLLEPDPAPLHLEHLVTRTVTLLKAGRFALSRVALGAKTEVLKIEVEISMREPAQGFAPEEAVRLGFEPPDFKHRGKAFFTLGSGRHVEAWISVEPARG